MSLVSLPAEFKPSSCILEPVVHQLVGADPSGGYEQATDLLKDRWKMACDLPARQIAQGGALEGFIGAMRGQTNWVNLYHFARPLPRGTARGTQVLTFNVSPGASSISIYGVSPANGTYLQGDLIGVGGMLLMCAADCVASGSIIVVPLVNRVRRAASASDPVTWYRPTAPFRLLSSSGVRYAPGMGMASSFEFGEYLGP